MRAFALGCCFLVLLHTGAVCQEDVLRPYGRGRSTPLSAAPNEVVPQRSPDGPGLILRGGIEGGLGVNLYSKSIEGILPTSPLSMISSGMGVSPMFGVYAELEISPTVSVGLRMIADQKNVSGSKSGLLQDCVINDAYGNPLQVTVATLTGDFTQTITFFTFTPVVRVDLMDHLFAQVGPTIHLPTGNLKGTTTLTIDPDDQCSFNFGQPNQSKVSTSEGEDPNIPAMRIGLDAALGYRIAIGDGLELVPRLGFQMMFTALDQESTGVDSTRELTDPPVRDYIARAASLNSLQASIALWFRL